MHPCGPALQEAEPAPAETKDYRSTQELDRILQVEPGLGALPGSNILQDPVYLITVRGNTFA